MPFLLHFSFLLYVGAPPPFFWICRTMCSSVYSNIFPTWCVVLDMITHFALELNNKWSATIWMIILVVVFKRFTTVRWLRLARSSVNHSEVGLCWWRWFVFFSSPVFFLFACIVLVAVFYLPVAFDFFSFSFGLEKACLTGRMNEANVATAQAIKCLHGMLLY